MRKLTALLIVFVFAFPVLLQFNTVASAVTPVTGPVTGPISFFNLTGDVTLRKLGKLFGGMQRVVPAEDTLVKVVGFFDKSKEYETMTNDEGEYHLNVPAGLYKIEVENEDNNFFVPPLRVVRVQENSTRDADFQGLLFP